VGPGFKYHVVTVAAIFFALTIGLVVGSLFVSPQLVDRQTRVLKDIRATLIQDNEAQKQKVERYQKFLAEIMPSLLNGKLAGMPVAIVQTGDYSEAVNPVREALQMADARVLSVTTIARPFDRPDEILAPSLVALHAKDPRFPTDREGLARNIASLLAHGDAPDNGLMAALEREGFVQTEPGSDYQTPARYVVIVAGSRIEGTTRPANVDRPLIAALQKQGLSVVACEPQDALASDITAYRALDMDVATVENVDTDIGHCALVFALRGDKDDSDVKAASRLPLP